MRGTVNFAVDLGTTNSLIAKFDRGMVQVFKNPNGFKETLPSVVGFRNDRILVGDQARSYAERDAKNVASRFKRKMGTTETIKINALQSTKTPVELSAYVLKESSSSSRVAKQSKRSSSPSRRHSIRCRPMPRKKPAFKAASNGSFCCKNLLQRASLMPTRVNQSNCATASGLCTT